MITLVTGGGGFLGRAIVDRLLARGDTVRSLSRADYPDLRQQGVRLIRADLSDAEAVRRACDGCEIVFHAAAKAGIWGSYASYYEPNVRGSENVLEACRAAGVPKLVYTSSPSVVFDGMDLENVDESLGCADHFDAYYPRTKCVAEGLVRNANCPALATVALRPHLIWGPRDNQLVPRILSRARKLRRIGRANKLVDSTYIDNAADAHLLAAERLTPDSPLAGKAYFISNGEPRPIWDLVNAILAAGGKKPVTRRIPVRLARAAGLGLECVYAALRLKGEPPMTRFLADELTTAHWFNISAARRDLGYEPRVSIDDGLQRLQAWLRETGLREYGLA